MINMIKKTRRVRVDRKKSEAKVIKEVLKNPLLSQQEIANRTWLSKWNVNDKLNNLDQITSKDDRILWVCDDDFEIIKLTQSETIRRIREAPSEISMSDIIRAWSESTKRYTIFKWEITDDQWWLKLTESESLLLNDLMS